MRILGQSPTSMGDSYGRSDLFKKFFKGENVSNYDIRFIDNCIGNKESIDTDDSLYYNQSVEFYKVIKKMGIDFSKIPYKINKNEILYLPELNLDNLFMATGDNVVEYHDTTSVGNISIIFKSDGYFLYISVREFDSIIDGFPEISYSKEILKVPTSFLTSPFNARKKMIDKRIEILSNSFQDLVMSTEKVKMKIEEELKKAKEEILRRLSDEEWSLVKDEFNS